jgi:Flp pilus assembly protein TadG
MRIGWHRRSARARRRFARDEGQALVEMALALPILLLLLVGIFEFARAYSIKQTLVNAAREGARQAVLQGVTVDSVTNVINGYLASNNIAPSTAASSPTTITIEPTGLSSAVAGTPVTITVVTRYDFLLMGPVVGLIGGSFANGVFLRSQTTMRHE